MENGARVLDYGENGLYLIQKTNKVKGTSSGDICQICEAGTLKEYGGCNTCSNCGAQLKCGL